MAEAQAAAPEAGAAAPEKSKDKSALFALVNLVFALSAIGMLVYTKLVYKRPAIVNSKEIERIKREHEKRQKEQDSILHKPGLVNFDPVNINLKSTHAFSQPGDPYGKVEGKMHYAQVGFSMEVRDGALIPAVEAIKPALYDKLLSLMGRKTYAELVNVQGRFVLKTQILDLINQLLIAENEKKLRAKREAHDPSKKNAHTDPEAKDDEAVTEDDEEYDIAKEIFVTQIYFTHFVVQ